MIFSHCGVKTRNKRQTMLTNKWIISDKETVPTKSGFLYTLILVDGDPSLYKTEINHIYSEKNLNLGDFTDYDLNPLNRHYNSDKTDIATVEFAKTYNVGDNRLKKLSLFGLRSGCFYSYAKKDQDFPIKRGDTLSVFVMKDLSFNMGKDEVAFKLMQNLTTGRKSPDFEYVIDNFNGFFYELVATGVDSAGTNETPATKGMLIYSPKFGYNYRVVSTNEVLFFTRTNDKLLVEHNPRNNTFEVLRNITTDNIRTEFVLNQR